MVISNHFPYKDLVHHPIDSQPFISMFGLRVPGPYAPKKNHPKDSQQTNSTWMSRVPEVLVKRLGSVGYNPSRKLTVCT